MLDDLQTFSDGSIRSVWLRGPDGVGKVFGVQSPDGVGRYGRRRTVLDSSLWFGPGGF